MADTLRAFLDNAALKVVADHALSSPSMPVPVNQAARNIEGAQYMTGRGDMHPSVARMYEQADRAKFRDVLVRGQKALESIRQSREPTAYLNDAAKEKAQRPAAPVRAPSSPASSASPRSSDGNTAGYVRTGPKGGMVQVTGYTTPTRHR